MSTPVILVHGLIHACGHLRGVAAEVGGRPFLVPDLPGYGTNDPRSETSIPRAVAYLEGWMREGGYRGAHLVGHSLGGAVVVHLAHRHPELVGSVVDLEGNFTLLDAFWSKGIAAGTEEEAEAMLAGHRADPVGWLTPQGIEPTPRTVAWAIESLDAQSGRSMRSMARSVVDITAGPEYLQEVRATLERGTPFHLLAGERSVGDWDVPDFVRRAAATSTVLPRVGHMMMLEDPEALLHAIAATIPGA
jgi:lipase